MRRIAGVGGALVAGVALTHAFAQPLPQAEPLPQYEQNLPLDDPAIRYRLDDPGDAVSRLTARIRRGEAALEARPGAGVLPDLLGHLGIAADSQLLVFSKTSFQHASISPRRPRAIYFGDDVAVARRAAHGRDRAGGHRSPPRGDVPHRAGRRRQRPRDRPPRHLPALPSRRRHARRARLLRELGLPDRGRHARPRGRDRDRPPHAPCRPLGRVVRDRHPRQHGAPRQRRGQQPRRTHEARRRRRPHPDQPDGPVPGARLPVAGERRRGADDARAPDADAQLPDPLGWEARIAAAGRHDAGAGDDARRANRPGRAAICCSSTRRLSTRRSPPGRRSRAPSRPAGRAIAAGGRCATSTCSAGCSAIRSAISSTVRRSTPCPTTCGHASTAACTTCSLGRIAARSSRRSQPADRTAVLEILRETKPGLPDYWQHRAAMTRGGPDARRARSTRDALEVEPQPELALERRSGEARLPEPRRPHVVVVVAEVDGVEQVEHLPQHFDLPLGAEARWSC